MQFALPLGLALATVAAVTVYPGWALLSRVGVKTMAAVLADLGALRALSHSLVATGASTALAVVAGLPVAWLLVRSDIRGKDILSVLLLLPAIVPPHVGALAWIQVYGPAGLLARILPVPWNLYSPGGIITLLAVYGLPPVILFSATALRAVPPELEEAARAAGAGPWAAFRTAVLPAALRGICAGAATAFAGGLGNFGVPALLGIPANYTMLTTYIYRQVTAFGPTSLERAAALSALVLAPLIVMHRLEEAGAHASQAGTDSRGSGALHRLGLWRPVAEALLWLLATVTAVLPLLVMVITSLLPAYGVPLRLGDLTLRNYQTVLSAGPGTALAMSLLLAAGAAAMNSAVGLVLGYWMSRWPSPAGHLVRFVTGLPYAVPGMVLGVAMILAFLRPVLGLRLYGTAWLLLIAYVARFMAVAVRASLASLQGIEPALEEAARASGAGLLTRLRTVVIPLAGPGLMGGAVLVFLIAFSELTVSSLLASSRVPTIGVAIYNLEEGGYSLQSTALASLTVAVILTGAALLDRALPARARRLLPWRP